MTNFDSAFMWTPLSTVTWLLWLSPLTLAGLLCICIKPRLRRWVGFVVLGTLVGYGVQLIVQRFILQLPASDPKNLSTGEYFIAILRINLYRSLVISLVCALPLMLWLRRLIARSEVGGGDS